MTHIFNQMVRMPQGHFCVILNCVNLLYQIKDVDTWPEEIAKVFTKKKECFIEQYNGYDVPDVSLKIDGKRTVIENIADNFGIKIAYRAYKRWEKDNKEKISRPIGLDFTPNQLFWIAAAQTWCGVYRTGKNKYNT